MTTKPTTQLLIFSKYHSAGKAKTRLIPAIGAANAAQLHRRMAEVTVETARLWCQKTESPKRKISLHYTGATETAFRNWLGSDLTYLEQFGDDLGERMKCAFTAAFKNGTHCAIGIGTDAPKLSPARLHQAEKSLIDHDLVVGPADDGGYYLIGMKEHYPELFAGIEWGTDKVLRQTLVIAARRGLKVAILERLSDIDRPDDLPQLRDDSRFCDLIYCTPRLSVIIPTLNEAQTLEKTLHNLQRLKSVEIIVADGGSDDTTGEIATRSGVKLIVAAGGRAAQLNRGAAVSRGKYLLFLHADTLLPANYPDLIISVLKDPCVSAGAFRFKTDHTGTVMRVIEWGTNLRSTRFQLPYGDQGLFLRRETFEGLGGFPLLPIMEDFAFVRKLRRRGTIVTLPEAAVTSARRWKTLGAIRTTVTNQLMIVGFLLGIPIQRLSHFYRGKKKR